MIPLSNLADRQGRVGVHDPRRIAVWEIWLRLVALLIVGFLARGSLLSEQ
jgi:hypothetical protein